MPPEEIEAAKRDMDELTYLQEYEAAFINFEGRVYYPFDKELHASERLASDPKLDLYAMFDFNHAPGVCAIGQEQMYKGNNPQIANFITALIDEIWIARDSNTQRVCRQFCQKYANHTGRVIVDGDATGGAGGSAKVLGSDVDIIYNELSRVFGGRLQMNFPAANPMEQVRINAVNSRLKTADGLVHMLFDPENCKNIIRDFEGVSFDPG
ncbi:hypothetical protein IID10_16550, partial [candidate division KSB1 bacterium]|nr:hypothetical protein [candidate division KSB1 bacterium]